MPTGLLQGEGSALAAAGAVSLPFGLGRLQISLYAVYRGFAALLCKSAFPNCNDGPGKRVEALGIEFVTGNVAGNLFSPELCIRLWLDILGTPAMTMPKATVDEDDGAALGKHQVRLSRKPLVIQPVTITPMPQLLPHHPLRRRIPGTDAGHVVRPLRRHLTHILRGFSSPREPPSTDEGRFIRASSKSAFPSADFRSNAMTRESDLSVGL